MMHQTRNAVLSACLCAAALALAPIPLMYPASQFGFFLFPIPLVSGVFMRSLVLGLFFAAVWVYQHGVLQSALMGFAFWGVGGAIFDATVSLAWGGNVPLNFYLLVSGGQSFLGYELRLFVLPASLFVTYGLRLYRIDRRSASLGAIYVALILVLALGFPRSYIYGEGGIPLSVVPQLAEVLPVLASFLFAYSFFRPYSRKA